MTIHHRPTDWLRSVGAQTDALDGLARFETWAELHRECPRGDWLLGIAARLGAPHDALVRAAIGCARVAAPHGDEAEAVLAVAARWADGQASEADVATATEALERAPAVDPASEAAQRAALAVGLGVADRDVLASAAAAAAESVILSSIDCGLELAMRWAHDKTATLVRAAIPWEILAPCVERIRTQHEG
jgi:hypothetical protein